MTDTDTQAANPVTASQRRAQAAYARVGRLPPGDRADYKRFAQSFPALIQSAGLAQAVAFALSKAKPGRPTAHEQVVTDLAEVLGRTRDALAADCRALHVLEYLRLSRDALHAAVWLKRYAEALIPDSPQAAAPGDPL